MLNNIKILLAEDEDLVRNQVVRALKFLSARVIVAEDGIQAYNIYLKEKPDIIITDIEMPGMKGLELAEKIRKTDGTVQIIVATAYTNTEYFLKAVELNLAKYLLKPIKLLELEDALNTCLENLSKIYTYEKYFNDTDYYDERTRTLIVKEKEVDLNFQEKLFLEVLLENIGQVVSYQKLEERVWEQGMSEGAIRSLVFSLRQKLPNNTLKNVSKTGYRILARE